MGSELAPARLQAGRRREQTRCLPRYPCAQNSYAVYRASCGLRPCGHKKARNPRDASQGIYRVKLCTFHSVAELRALVRLYDLCDLPAPIQQPCHLDGLTTNATIKPAHASGASRWVRRPSTPKPIQRRWRGRRVRRATRAPRSSSYANQRPSAVQTAQSASPIPHPSPAPTSSASGTTSTFFANV